MKKLRKMVMCKFNLKRKRDYFKGDNVVKRFKITEENVYSEYYGVPFETLKEFSDLCKDNDMIFCDCIYGDERGWEYFKRYLKKVYGLSSSLMNHDMGFGAIGLNGPTSNKEKYEENLRKIKEVGGRIYELQKKIQKAYDNNFKKWDLIIHSSNWSKQK